MTTEAEALALRDNIRAVRDHLVAAGVGTTDRTLWGLVLRVVEERDEARAQVERLTDLVRHARGPLHEDGLLTDEEYRDLAEDSGAVVRLTTLAQLQGDVARETRAKNVAVGERDAYKRAKEENDERFMIERDDARRERDEARAVLAVARDRLSDLYGDSHHQEQAARGVPPETLDVLVERAVTVDKAAMAGRAQAIAAARVDGARGMLDKVRERTAALRVTVGAVCEADTCPDVDMDDEIHDLWLTLDQIDALDPATVGSGS